MTYIIHMYIFSEPWWWGRVGKKNLNIWNSGTLYWHIKFDLKAIKRKLTTRYTRFYWPRNIWEEWGPTPSPPPGYNYFASLAQKKKFYINVFIYFIIIAQAFIRCIFIHFQIIQINTEEGFIFIPKYICRYLF